MSANIPKNGNPRQLDRRPDPDERITEEQVKDLSRLARLLERLLKDVATLTRRWRPRRIDFEDRAVDATGTMKHRFAHGLRGRVRWWVVDWQGAAGPQLSRHAESDATALVLVSHVAGTVTIRVEEAG